MPDRHASHTNCVHVSNTRCATVSMQCKSKVHYRTMGRSKSKVRYFLMQHEIQQYTMNKKRPANVRIQYLKATRGCVQCMPIAIFQQSYKNVQKRFRGVTHTNAFMYRTIAKIHTHTYVYLGRCMHTYRAYTFFSLYHIYTRSYRRWILYVHI